MGKVQLGIAIFALVSIASCTKPPPEQGPSPASAPTVSAAQAPTGSTPNPKAPTIVNFPGEGKVEFPAGMSPDAIDRITNAIRKQEQAVSSPASSPVTGGLPILGH